jgi:cell division protein FtsW
MINMGVAVDLLPVTGQTLPLVSMGGSSLLFTSVAFGIILSVSRGVDTIEENATQDETAKAKVNAEPVVEEV